MPDRSAIASRMLAAAIHLGGSLVVAGAAAALVFLLWYPWPFSALAGGAGLFVLITSVDVILGPVITLAVFNIKKPARELRKDLAVVILLQLAALAYGLHTMYTARPVALALESSRLRTVTANAVIVEELAMAPAALQQLPITGPILLRTVAPVEAGEQMEAIEKALAGADLGVRPKYWQPWDDVARQEARKAGQPLPLLRKRYPLRSHELDAAISKSGLTESGLGYLPIVSRFANWVALIDMSTGDIVGYAPFDGF